MEDRLARELQVANPEPEERTGPPGPPGELMGDLVEIAGESAALSPEVQQLIVRCMEGTEPLENRKYWQQQSFNSQNIQVVLLRVAGFKQVEIARMLGLDQARVSVTMRHPYARKILHALIPQQATRVIDIRTRMEEQASELMDHAFSLAMKSEDVKEVKDVTFGFLDRAGYNVVQKGVGVNVTPADLRGASDSSLKRLASALDGSKLVDSVVMPNWSAPPPPDEGAALAHNIVEGSFDDVASSVPDGGRVGPQVPVPESAESCSGSQGHQRTDPQD